MVTPLPRYINGRCSGVKPPTEPMHLSVPEAGLDIFEDRNCKVIAPPAI
jgi:hypothetical protein